MRVKTRLICFLLSALMLAAALPAFAQVDQLVEGKLARPEIPLKASYPDNEPVPGISSTTGLPFSGDYLPVMIVIDNAPAAHPHWGLSQADVLYQVPNAGGGATKLMGLFADHAPRQAGGVRSARQPFVDIAHQWGAAFAYAGNPDPERFPQMDVPGRLRAYGMRNAALNYNLLGNNNVSERVKWNLSPHNLSVNIEAIQAQMRSKGLRIKPQGFLFTDVLPEDGVAATSLSLQHRGTLAFQAPHPASYSTFSYDQEQNAYFRTNSSGIFVDMHDDMQPIAFSNVIVQRTKFKPIDPGYVGLPSFVGSGAAEIFTGGRYIAGAWSHAAADQRTVFVDGQGEEIALQRGRTFIIITNEVTELRWH